MFSFHLRASFQLNVIAELTLRSVSRDLYKLIVVITMLKVLCDGLNCLCHHQVPFQLKVITVLT